MDQKLITTFLTIALAIFLTFFLIIPKFQEATDARRVVSEQREIIGMLTDRMDSTKGELEKLKALELGDIDRVFKAVPSSLDAPNLLFNLETLSSSAGLVIESVNIREEIETSNGRARSSAGSSGLKPTFLDQQTGAGSQVSVVSINMSVRGSYGSFKDFLRGLEDNLRLFDMETIAFMSAKVLGVSVGENLSFNIVFKTYFIK